MRNIYSYKGKSPRIGNNVFIDPAARVIGDVEIGDDSAVLFGAIIRGDSGKVKLGNKVVVLENVIIEAPENEYVVIGGGSLVSHGAIVHGAKIGGGVLIGIGAIILDNSYVGDEAIVGAGAVVTPNTEVPPETLVLGVPAKKVRKVTAYEKMTIAEEVDDVLRKAVEYNKIFSHT